MKIKFIGATKTVTGSMHLIQTNGKSILLDCGLYQGKRKDYYEINSNFNYFEPYKIDYLIVSHSHIDHIGNIPNLVKQGFGGKIICTKATKDLGKVMLLDSGHIQEKDVEFVNKKRKKHGEPPLQPLYTQQDAENTFSLFEGYNYYEPIQLNEDIELTFFNAGHILGSAIINLKIKENGKLINLVFTGDLGRKNLPIIKDPDIVETPHFLISEATYGGRLHQSQNETKSILVDSIFFALKRNGKIIIPAFSESRTQQLILLFHEIFDQHHFKFPIYIDSPLATSITKIYEQHTEEYDKETSEYLKHGLNPFRFNYVHFTSSVDESKALNEMSGPMIIISASGMCETGRILHHLANNIENPNNQILIVGYMAAETLGRKIADGEKKVKIFGEEYNVKAKVTVLDALSAHADQRELIEYFNNFDRKKLREIFLVHGEETELSAFQKILINENFRNIHIPSRGDVFEV
ncbi:MAG: MBL fold metallo-hydrolase [Ignavibacteria bacterium]|nr:MBL fold metallo-hydrolase [Ignavibacteria bacterium]